MAFIEAFRRLLNPTRVDATVPVWLPVATETVSVYRQASAELASDYYRNHRGAELGGRSGVPDVVPELAPAAEPEAVRTSLMVCGPVTLKRATAQGRTIAEATRIAEVRSEAAASRHVLNGGRDTIRRSINRDSLALGWARVTDGDPCWLCAMQASRGPVFKSRRSAILAADGQRYHDRCGCGAEPVYSKNAPWPGDARDWQKLWNEVAKGRPADEARKAFRRALDAQSGTRSPDARRKRREINRNAPGEGQEPLPEPDTDARGTTPEPEPEPEHDVPEPRPAATEQAPASDPLAGTDLTSLSDDELFELFGLHADDPDALSRIAAELDTRDNDGNGADDQDHDDGEATADDDLTFEQQRVEELVSQGWDWQEAYAETHNLDVDDLDAQARAADVDAQRMAGESRDDTVKRLYREYVHMQYLAAEDATRGHMLSKTGQAEGIDPIELFSGPTARAHKYASEDLLRWWADHGRMTFTQYKAQLLGRDSDKQAAQTTAAQSNGRVFI